MNQAAKTMIVNLYKNTGQTLEQWIETIKKKQLEKYGQIINSLKEEHNITHGFANLAAFKYRMKWTL